MTRSMSSTSQRSRGAFAVIRTIAFEWLIERIVAKYSGRV
jgi:hypothetical protein